MDPSGRPSIRRKTGARLGTPDAGLGMTTLNAREILRLRVATKIAKRDFRKERIRRSAQNDNVCLIAARGRDELGFCDGLLVQSGSNPRADGVDRAHHVQL